MSAPDRDDQAPAKLTPEHEKAVTTQRYDPAPAIAGVEVADLRVFADDSGELAELARLEPNGALAAFPGFHVRQVNHAVVEPGGIKAWHIHRKQSDVWFVPPGGRLVVGLVDTRAGSPTEGARLRLVLGAGRAQLVRIPPGVAHGCGNLSHAPVTMVYFHDRQFDAGDPDEHRLPWDHFGADFWAPTRG